MAFYRASSYNDAFIACDKKSDSQKIGGSFTKWRKGGKLIIVDDDADGADIVVMWLVTDFKGLSTKWFLDCETLLAAMAAGERADVYLVDYNLGRGMNGSQCTTNILQLHKGANVIGNSTSNVSAEFKRAGAIEFYGKLEGLEALTRILKPFLK